MGLFRTDRDLERKLDFAIAVLLQILERLDATDPNLLRRIAEANASLTDANQRLTEAAQKGDR